MTRKGIGKSIRFIPASAGNTPVASSRIKRSGDVEISLLETSDCKGVGSIDAVCPTSINLSICSENEGLQLKILVVLIACSARFLVCFQ